MLRLTLAAGVACAVVLGNPVGAQFNSSGIGSNGGGGTSMPGQVVGGYRGQVNPVGNKAPAAAPAAGQPITANAMQRPYDPNRPYDALKGTSFTQDQIVAPLVGPDGRQVAPPDSLDILSEKIRAIWGLAKPAPPRPAYTPGIGRRTKDRTDHMWRRD